MVIVSATMDITWKYVVLDRAYKVGLRHEAQHSQHGSLLGFVPQPNLRLAETMTKALFSHAI